MEETSLRVYTDTRDSVNAAARLLEEMGHGRQSQDDTVRLAINALISVIEKGLPVYNRTATGIRKALEEIQVSSAEVLIVPIPG